MRPNVTRGAERWDPAAQLSRCCEIELDLACGCLALAYGAMADAEAAGLTDGDLKPVAAFRDKLVAEARSRMAELAQASMLMVAIGVVPALRSKQPKTYPTSATAEVLEHMGELAGEIASQKDTLIEHLRLLPAEGGLPCAAESTAVTAALDVPLIAITDLTAAMTAVTAIAKPGDTFPYLVVDLAAARTQGRFPPPRATGPEAAGQAEQVAGLLADAYETLLMILTRCFCPGEETDAEIRQLFSAALRLMTSVICPLAAAVIGLRAGELEFGSMNPPPLLTRKSAVWTVLDGRLWNLARAATRLRCKSWAGASLIEATAAAQGLACALVSPELAATRIQEFRQLQALLPTEIIVVPNGPYLATNVGNVADWLGCGLPLHTPQLALCRCGRSKRKPLCDGSHTSSGFSGAKDAGRVPDRLQGYRRQTAGSGKKPLIFTDNRGLCAHSGFCTDILPETFRADKEPFADPNASEVADIVRVIRTCPSGALGLPDRRADQERPPTILISRDGPYRVSGSIPLRRSSGVEEPRNEGGSAEHYSLCRCGYSQNKPFCSGMHWYSGFKDPEYREDHEWTIFEWMGGLPAITRAIRLFYEKYVPDDPVIGPLFAHARHDHIERVSAWLAETFGGPAFYTDRYGGYPRMLSQHVGKGLTEEKRARWVELLTRAVNHAGLPNDPEFRSALASYIEWGSRLAVENSQPGAVPPRNLPVPRWNWGTAGPPGSRISALAAEKAAEPSVPEVAASEAVSFASHIKPLFRVQDRQSMKFAFDLWSVDDVRANAQGVLSRLRDGSMPCDGAWPEEKIGLFRRWCDTGMGD